MAKIFRLRSISATALQRRKELLANDLSVPPHALRASLVVQFLTCGKKGCRCRSGQKHGPFRYLVQCLKSGTVRKFLIKTHEAELEAKQNIAAYVEFQ